MKGIHSPNKLKDRAEPDVALGRLVGNCWERSGGEPLEETRFLISKCRDVRSSLKLNHLTFENVPIIYLK